MRPHPRLCLVGAIVALALGSDAASAQSPVPEPNENIAQAFGPLDPSLPYAGAFDSPNDVEWLLFYVNGLKQIDVSVSKVGLGCSDYVTVDMLDSNGGRATGDFVYSDTTVHLQTTTASAGPYYLRLAGTCAGDAWQVQAGPRDAVTTAITGSTPRPTTTATATGEPNDTTVQASGP